MRQEDFQYSGERFADLQMLRYQLPGFEALTPKQKTYIYYLAEATLWGRDIIYDQWGRYNLLIRKTLEAIYIKRYKGMKRCLIVRFCPILYCKTQYISL